MTNNDVLNALDEAIEKLAMEAAKAATKVASTKEAHDEAKTLASQRFEHIKVLAQIRDMTKSNRSAY